MFTLAAADTIAGVATSASKVTYTIFGDAATGSDSFQVLAQGQLAAAAGTIYTVPSSTNALISAMTFVNNDTGTQTVTIYRGGTAAANAICTFQIPAGGTAQFNGERLEIHDSSGATLSTISLAQVNPQPITDTTTAVTSGVGRGAPIDHVHYHGVLAGGTLHAAASESAAGFISASDQAKLNNITGAHMTATQTVSGTQATGTVLTGLSVLLDNPGQAYAIDVDIDANISATSSTAVGVGLNLPTGATLSADIIGGTNATAQRMTYFTAGASCQQSFVTTSGVTLPIHIDGVIVLGTATSHTGSVQVIANSTGTATIQAGEILVLPIS